MTIKPRQLVLDLFGDYLRYVDEVQAGDIGALLSEFGVEPATSRVTLSRLRQEEWFTTRRAGRETFYRPTARLIDILDEGRERIFAPYPEEWDGAWTTVVFQLPEADRATRDTMRRTLSWLGFAQLAGTTWISPRPAGGLVPQLRHDFPDVRIDAFSSRAERPADDSELVARCWDISSLADDYREFLVEHRALGEQASLLEGVDALRARTELTFHYRRFPFRDPGLPRQLRPESWPGADAHHLFQRTHDELEKAAVMHIESIIGVPVGAELARAQNM